MDLSVQRSQQLDEEKRKAAEEESKLEWGRGIAQKRQQDDMKRRMEEEKKSSLAVYADDSGLNASLKEKVLLVVFNRRLLSLLLIRFDGEIRWLSTLS